MLPLTKTLDPIDLITLAPEVTLVEAVGIGEQHPYRTWEYAMALRAISQHQLGYVAPSAGYLVLDVGGAGSPFVEICRRHDLLCTVVDPKVNEGIETYRAPDDPADAVISISTIEHVKDEQPFLAACHCALAPGGLLFLTFDYWDGNGPDTAHFHWMRERIYNWSTWGRLVTRCQAAGFVVLGGVDYSNHGNHVYDYTFASLALTKET